ncbi:hypothetical protein Tco_0833183 [Tanacetum coccineum]
MRKLNTTSGGVEESEYGKILFSDVMVTRKRNHFLGRKWRTVDIKIGIGILGETHLIPELSKDQKCCLNNYVKVDVLFFGNGTLSAKFTASSKDTIGLLLRIFHQLSTLSQVSFAMLHDMKRCYSISMSLSYTGHLVEFRSIPLRSRLERVGSLDQAQKNDRGGLTMGVGLGARSIIMHSELDSNRNNLGKESQSNRPPIHGSSQKRVA